MSGTRDVSPGQESEIKVLLAPEHMDAVRASLGSPQRVMRQISHFYETPDDRLSQSRLSMRVREECRVGGDGAMECFLTVKGAGLQAGALVVRPELECCIDRDAWLAIESGRSTFASLDLPPLKHLAKAVAPIEEMALRKIGEITNIREVFTLHDESMDLEVLLDSCTFPDGSTDHELECEVSQAKAGTGARILRSLFDRLRIEWVPSEKGKYQRFRQKTGRPV